VFRFPRKVTARRVDGTRIVRVPVLILAVVTLAVAGLIPLVDTPAPSQATSANISTPVQHFDKAAGRGWPAMGNAPAIPSTTVPPSTSNAGTVNPAASLSDAVPSSSISSVFPTSGTAGGGATVRITGADLTGAQAVYFGSNPSSDFTVTSPTSITAVAPVGAGTVDVRVQMPGGTTAASSADHFTYVPTGQLPITAQGQNLEIGGVPTKFAGYDAYQLATVWGTNAGCGVMPSTAQIDAFFGSLRPNSLVRFWAFQGSMATDGAGQLDWRPLDNVFYAAAKYHVYLIPVISDQGGTCDGNHWQDPAWYSGGFMNVYNSAANSDGRGLTPLSYWDYMNALVSRYADSPALGLWEPMNEPEASTCPAADEPTSCGGHQSCPNEGVAASALEYFFTTVGGQIHRLDPEHLVEGGFIGSGQCGTSGPDYQAVGASSGLDVLSVHDYYGSTPMGGDQWNGLAVRFAQAKALNKPIITGETGILAGNGQRGCESLPQRASDLSAKMSAQFAAGDSALLVWNWELETLGPCSYDTGPGDTSLSSALASAPGA
jgi:mannan endo-1,4-beta-mannosidase